jgi:hypothetical protein
VQELEKENLNRSSSRDTTNDCSLALDARNEGRDAEDLPEAEVQFIGQGNEVQELTAPRSICNATRLEVFFQIADVWGLRPGDATPRAPLDRDLADRTFRDTLSVLARGYEPLALEDAVDHTLNEMRAMDRSQGRAQGLPACIRYFSKTVAGRLLGANEDMAVAMARGKARVAAGAARRPGNFTVSSVADDIFE